MQATQMTELEELECIYCELHKDVYGVKARWYRAESVEQARKDLDALEAEGVRVAEDQRRYQEQAALRFERLVSETIASGARDRATALRWIHQAMGTDGDNEFLCHQSGLRYDYLNK
jgi:hypothetical protein